MAERKYVDVTVKNNSGHTVALRFPEGHDLVEHLQKMAKRDDLESASVKPYAERKTAAK